MTPRSSLTSGSASPSRSGRWLATSGTIGRDLNEEEEGEAAREVDVAREPKGQRGGEYSVASCRAAKGQRQSV